MKNYEIAMDLGVDIVRRNGYYETCDLYSPAMLSQFLKARINEEARIVHEAGSVMTYSVLTGYTPMVDHLASLDFDCLFSPDPSFEGEDPRRLMQRCGDRKSFWTGPSDTIQMPWDDQKAVESVIEQVFEIYGKTGLLITVCSSSKPFHPWENMIAMIDTWKRLR